MPFNWFPALFLLGRIDAPAAGIRQRHSKNSRHSTAQFSVFATACLSRICGTSRKSFVAVRIAQRVE
jgi:hypothetical protein